MKLTIVTPAFNEAENLPILYERVVAAMAGRNEAWEWLIVDDHSRDRTFAAIEQLALRDPRVRGVRLARNSGSHVAITCGLHHAAGDAAALLVADLQDPPEMLPRMLDRWRAGAHVVWAARRSTPGERRQGGFAAIYYWMVRHLGGLADMPPGGVDFFVIDRLVIDAFGECSARNASVFIAIMRLGFRQECIEFDKQPRAHGQSGWTLARKIKLVVDSVVSLSEFPVRWCGYAGVALALGALLVAAGALFLLPTLAAGLLLVAALLLGLAGIQLTALSIVGQYVCRALDEARRTPAYAVEAVAGQRQAALSGPEPGQVAPGVR